MSPAGRVAGQKKSQQFRVTASRGGAGRGCLNGRGRFESPTTFTSDKLIQRTRQADPGADGCGSNESYTLSLTATRRGACRGCRNCRVRFASPTTCTGDQLIRRKMQAAPGAYG